MYLLIHIFEPLDKNCGLVLTTKLNNKVCYDSMYLEPCHILGQMEVSSTFFLFEKGKIGGKSTN